MNFIEKLSTKIPEMNADLEKLMSTLELDRLAPYPIENLIIIPVEDTDNISVDAINLEQEFYLLELAEEIFEYWIVESKDSRNISYLYVDDIKMLDINEKFYLYCKLKAYLSDLA